MPGALNHSESRAKHCIVCVKKKKCVRPITEEVKQQIETHYKSGLDFEHDDRLPTKICGLCRHNLRQIASGKRVEKIPVFDYRLLNYPPDRRNGMYFRVIGDSDHYINEAVTWFSVVSVNCERGCVILLLKLKIL